MYRAIRLQEGIFLDLWELQAMAIIICPRNQPSLVAAKSCFPFPRKWRNSAKTRISGNGGCPSTFKKEEVG
jgi:hypothetical protein